MKVKKLLNFIWARYAPRGAKLSFSASGEDIVMSDILKNLGIENFFYIDIGAHDPIIGNNTYLFYRMGGRGILVEPNPELCKEIKKRRSRDVCINAGVGKSDSEADFYLFPQRTTRSTFSKGQAEEWEKNSGQKAHIQQRQIFSLDTVINKYCNGKVPSVVSIDAEGLDVEILEGFSFTKRPNIFCIESALYDKQGLKKLDDILVPFMEKHGYTLSTKISHNAIFVDKK
jgi:FkbM family methyltransferase